MERISVQGLHMTFSFRQPYHFGVLVDLEESSFWPDVLKRFQGCEPNFDASLDGKALGNTRDDDLAGSGDLYVFEIPIVGQEHEIGLRGESPNDVPIGAPSAPKDDVLGVMAGIKQAGVQAKRKVLVEQEPQESSLTAGGVWSARCVA